jgi:hypothetical protein
MVLGIYILRGEWRVRCIQVLHDYSMLMYILSNIACLSSCDVRSVLLRVATIPLQCINECYARQDCTFHFRDRNSVHIFANASQISSYQYFSYTFSTCMQSPTSTKTHRSFYRPEFQFAHHDHCPVYGFLNHRWPKSGPCRNPATWAVRILGSDVGCGYCRPLIGRNWKPVAVVWETPQSGFSGIGVVSPVLSRLTIHVSYFVMWFCEDFYFSFDIYGWWSEICMR